MVRCVSNHELRGPVNVSGHWSADDICTRANKHVNRVSRQTDRYDGPNETRVRPKYNIDDFLNRILNCQSYLHGTAVVVDANEEAQVKRREDR